MALFEAAFILDITGRWSIAKRNELRARENLSPFLQHRFHKYLNWLHMPEISGFTGYLQLCCPVLLLVRDCSLGWGRSFFPNKTASLHLKTVRRRSSSFSCATWQVDHINSGGPNVKHKRWKHMKAACFFLPGGCLPAECASRCDSDFFSWDRCSSSEFVSGLPFNPGN